MDNHRITRFGASPGISAAVLLAVCIAPRGVPAQERLDGEFPPTSTRGYVADDILRATRFTEGSIEVDGDLGDEPWRGAQVIRGFVQGEPVEGVPAEEDTEVRLLFGPDAVYVSARMYDSEPEAIASQLVRRDGRGAFDWFAVSLDPNLDRRTGYRFQVSAAGVQSDAYLYDDDRSDGAWDAVWSSAVRRDDDGWTVEMRIPLSQIRFTGSEGPRSWGVNFARRRVRSGETSYYALQSRLEDGTVSQFARLAGVRLPEAGRRIEVRPYLLSRLRGGPAEPGDPFFDGSATDARVGADVSLGLGSAFTLDATFNPDFGQVESDPATINLSAFETFLEERRPFFVEDARILDFRLSGWRDQLFYSRRIGRAPRGRAPGEADFTDVPEAAPILGSAKVTGRTAGGLSVGGLVALTDEVTGRAARTEEEEVTRYMAEPRAGYGVVRAQQELNGGETTVGGIVTATGRALPSDGSFDFLPSEAYSGGLDFEHRWADREWAVSGYLAGSHVRGSAEAITRIQRASNHYFQRPDASRLSVDSTATAMTGASWRLRLDKRSGRHWTGGLWVGASTPGFEVNDLGFSQSREALDAGLRLDYRQIEPGSVFRNYSLGFSTSHGWSHEALDDVWSVRSWGRAHQEGRFRLDARGELLNYWGVGVDVGFDPATYSRSATRGGPVMREPGSVSASVRVNTDRRRSVSLSGRAGWSSDTRGPGGDWSVGAGMEIRPTPTVEIEVEPRFSVRTSGSQYVTSTPTLPYEPTFGRRYLFAELDRTSLSVETRVDVALSPTLTFQLYAQPLLSSGDYVRYRQLAEAGSGDFLDFRVGEAVTGDGGEVRCGDGSICLDGGRQYVDFDGDGTVDYDFPDRDFNVRSLIGNAVARWEFRPGSTLFLVWQRRQTGRASVGDFDVARDLDALWGAPADDVFMVKMTYWLGL